MTTGSRPQDRDEILESAAKQALQLRVIVDGLSDPVLRAAVDLILYELGLQLADRLSECRG